MKTQKIDEAIELLTKLRIESVKKGMSEFEQKLYEVEIKLFGFYDENATSLTKESTDKGITISKHRSSEKYLDPKFMAEMSKRRTALKLSLNQVYSGCGVHIYTTQKVEKGLSVRAASVEKLDQFYTKKEEEFFKSK